MVQQLDPRAYTVGWVCALKNEVTASRVLLDEEHKRPPKQPNDDNNYIVGRMEDHNVVIAFPGAGSYGSDVISQTAAHMVRTFNNIRFGLMVGIGGAAPAPPSLDDPLNDIRLGDVVVSEPKGNHGGVLQYDKGQWKEDGFEIRSHLNRPPKILLTAMKLLQSDHEIGMGEMNSYFDDISKGSTRLKKWGFQFPGRHLDQLFKPSYTQIGCTDCSGCEAEPLEKRLDRENDEPAVHYGLIASASAVMKFATQRDFLRDAWGVSCFEMEAAGLMNEFPCLIIRGISDYSDEHKNDAWQRYAAARAATYAKDLLRIMEPEEVSRVEIAAQIAGNLSRVLNNVDANVARTSERIEDDQITRILDWFCPLEYGAEQRDFLDKRQGGTGQWMLDSPQFQDWYQGKGKTLLCQGIPGAGKTIMAAIVNDFSLHSRD
ncbi:hypothetical protein N7540_009020 [Penicillium herquei]|nr:hypothetical protein N7540_009020 [Penicillium herquei]